MADNTKQELADYCQRLADELSGRNEDWKKEFLEEHSEDEEYKGYELKDIGAKEWLEDVLDIEYRVSREREYNSAEICVAYGGPNVYIDTKREYVIGVWGGDTVEIPYTDRLGIDDELSERWDGEF